MAKTGSDRMREYLEREEYCDPGSQISINRAFAERLAKLLKGTPEAAQLEVLITKNRDRIKSQCADTNNRPIIS